MRNGILFLAIAVSMMMSQAVLAHQAPEKELRNVITDLVKEEVLNSLEEGEEVSVDLKFIVTKDQQIRVVKVASDNEEVATIVKECLEYAYIDMDNVFKKFHYNLRMNFSNPRS